MKYEGKNKLVWERSNFEPEFDLEIMYNTYFYDIEARQNEEYISNEYLNAAIDEIKEFEELDFLLDGMSKEELINLYNKYLDDEKVGIAKYIQSKIPDSVFNKKGPIIKKISYYNGFISCIAESDNRDYAYANLKVTHIENGEEIIDYNDSLDVFHLSGRSPIDQGMYFSFLPDIEYHIEYLIKDSYGNMDIKTLKYPSGLYVQNEASIPTSSEDNSNDTNIPLVDEEFTNNTSIPATDEVIENDTNISLPDIEYDDGTNKIKVSFSDDNSNQRNILPLAIALGILLLSAVLLLAFTLQKRKQQRNNQTIK